MNKINCPVCNANPGIDLASTAKGETLMYSQLAYGYGSILAGKTLCGRCYNLAVASKCAQNGKHKLCGHKQYPGDVCMTCFLHYPAVYIPNGSNCIWCSPICVLPPIKVVSNDKVTERPEKSLPSLCSVLPEHIRLPLGKIPISKLAISKIPIEKKSAIKKTAKSSRAQRGNRKIIPHRNVLQKIIPRPTTESFM
jgi:hypothetical protein